MSLHQNTSAVYLFLSSFIFIYIYISKKYIVFLYTTNNILNVYIFLEYCVNKLYDILCMWCTMNKKYICWWYLSLFCWSLHDTLNTLYIHIDIKFILFLTENNQERSVIFTGLLGFKPIKKNCLLIAMCFA